MSRYEEAIQFAERQVRAIIERTPDFFPIYTRGGIWKHDGELWTDWCGGFLAGMMWLFHERTGDPWWRGQAEHYSSKLEHRQLDRDVHDLGFIFLNTYLPWYRLTGDGQLRDVLIQAGRTLALRFQKAGRYLCSFIGAHSLFIDIMMNVPLVFYAARESGNEQLHELASQHCWTTRQYLVRADGSTAHEAIFDPATGRFVRQATQQGLAADSCWARGLAWAMYGFATVYDYTQEPLFLEAAQRCARYLIEHLPPDRIPYWDFHADPARDPCRAGTSDPRRASLRDSSAAAIAASGLWNLGRLSADDRRGKLYRKTAVEIVDALTSDAYLARSDPEWQGILKHGVYHLHQGLGVDESVMWGDFFFVEALTKVVWEEGRSATDTTG